MFLDSRELPKGTLQYIGRLEGSLLIKAEEFNGAVEVWKEGDEIFFINEMPLEEYVKGVVAAESGKDWPLEAYKVQAVIARTYALSQIKKNQGLPFHITSTVMHQVFKNGPYDEKVTRAVEETKGEVILYNGEPIEALYHSTSRETTEDPLEVFGFSYPYLRPVKVTARLSPYSSWQRSISLREIEDATGIRPIEDIYILTRTSTGRAKEILIKTPSGTRRIKAQDLRRLLGWQRLPSTDFEVSRQGDFIIFRGSGYGHGVGLSQWSSLDMVLEGKSYREIINYFYPHTTIGRI